MTRVEISSNEDALKEYTQVVLVYRLIKQNDNYSLKTPKATAETPSFYSHRASFSFFSIQQLN